MARKGYTPLETKASLQNEDFKATKAVRPKRFHHDHLYQAVLSLSRKYSLSRPVPFPICYFMLKSMIRTCIERSKERVECIYDTLEERRGLPGLMEKNAEINDIKSEYSGFSMDELKSDIAEKKREKMRLTVDTTRLREAVTRLEEDFKNSKRYCIFQRYTLLKQMVKRTVMAIR